MPPRQLDMARRFRIVRPGDPVPPDILKVGADLDRPWRLCGHLVGLLIGSAIQLGVMAEPDARQLGKSIEANLEDLKIDVQGLKKMAEEERRMLAELAGEKPL